MPNRTELEGVVVSRADHPSMPGYDLVTLDLRDARKVEGMADMLSRRVGERLDIAVRKEAIPDGDLAGWSLSAVASLAGPGVVRADQLLAIKKAT